MTLHVWQWYSTSMQSNLVWLVSYASRIKEEGEEEEEGEGEDEEFGKLLSLI